MKTKPVYLVVDTHGARPTVVRSRQSWPQLEPGEILVRVALEIPDELLPNLYEIEVDSPDALAIAVEAVPLEHGDG